MSELLKTGYYTVKTCFLNKFFCSLGRKPYWVAALAALWGFGVELSYTHRRINCKRCGVKVEWMPWTEGNSHLTNAFKIFLSRWAKRLSWKETGKIFGVSWDTVYKN